MPRSSEGFPCLRAAPLLSAPSGQRLRHKSVRDGDSLILVQRCQRRQLLRWRTVSDRTLMHWNRCTLSSDFEASAAWLDEHQLGYRVERENHATGVRLELVEYRLDERFWYEPIRVVHEVVTIESDEDAHLRLAELRAELSIQAECHNERLMALARQDDESSTPDGMEDDGVPELLHAIVDDLPVTVPTVHRSFTSTNLQRIHAS